MNVFALDRNRTFYPGQFSAYSLSIAPNIEMIKEREVRKSRAINAVETIEHPPSGGGDTEVNMTDASWKSPYGSEWFAGQPRRIGSSSRWNTVNISTLSVIPEDANLILHPAALQKLRMQHHAALSPGGENIGRACLECEVQTILGHVGLHAERHFEFPCANLQPAVRIEIHIVVFPGMPLVIASKGLTQIAFDFVIEVFGDASFQPNPRTSQIERRRGRGE